MTFEQKIYDMIKEQVDVQLANEKQMAALVEAGVRAFIVEEIKVYCMKDAERENVQRRLAERMQAQMDLVAAQKEGSDV